MYKVFEKKYLVAAGKIFRKTTRLDFVRPSKPRKHLCPTKEGCRGDGKTAKMEVNEFLSRLAKVRIVLTLFAI